MSSTRNWITYGCTESGDDLPIIQWGNDKPTDALINAAYRERLEEEFAEVGFVNWKLTTAEEP